MIDTITDKDRDDINKSMPKWDKYEVISFKTTIQLLEWVRSDKESLAISNKVFDACKYLKENNLQKMLVALLVVENLTEIFIMVDTTTLELMIKSYYQKLLELESYERLSEVKKVLDTFGIELTSL